jgi:hypothetical protein
VFKTFETQEEKNYSSGPNLAKLTELICNCNEAHEDLQGKAIDFAL